MLIEIKSLKELSTIQRYLAINLKEAKYSGNDIAQKLGVTSACVSQYLKGKRATGISLSEVADKVDMLSIVLIKRKKAKLLTMLKVGFVK